MTKEVIRIKNFLNDLDQYMLDNEYWDDEKQESVCTVTKEKCYDEMMKTKEYHLLTTEKVKGFIDIFFEDYESRFILLKQFKAL